MKTKATTLLFSLFLIACSGDAFTSVPSTTAPDSAVTEAADTGTQKAPVMDDDAAPDAVTPVTEAGADAPPDTHVPADCTFCPNTADNSNCDPNGGWTGNACPCECFVGLSVQAVAHCGQNGCTCEASKFPKNPGLSCIKTAP